MEALLKDHGTEAQKRRLDEVDQRQRDDKARRVQIDPSVTEVPPDAGPVGSGAGDAAQAEPSRPSASTRLSEGLLLYY